MKANVLTLAALAAILGSASVYAAKPKSDKSIVILFENDAHGATDGYAKVASIYDSVAKADTAYLGLVGVGDFIYGSKDEALTNTQKLVETMNSMHYDAMEIGNHEFDIDVSSLISTLGKLKNPITCVNFTDMEGNRIFEQYVIKEYGKKKVAYVGVLTTMAMRIARAAFYDSNSTQIYNIIGEDAMISAVQEAVTAARKAGADYVVLLSHIGERDKYSSARIVQETTGIDAVLDAHTHSVVPCNVVTAKDGKQVPIAQTGQKFANLGKLIITSDGRITTELLPL